MKKIITMIMMSVSLSLYANVFNSNLTASEKAVLDSGKVLIKSIPSVKKLSVERDNRTKDAIDNAKELNPTYVAEIIQVRPYVGNEDLLEKIDKTLLDMNTYLNIPYYSERTEKMYKLYDSATLLGKDTVGNKTKVSTILEMSVFGKFHAQFDIDKNDSRYFYKMKNLDKLRYHDKFNAVGKEKMQSVITVFRDGDNWILYAIGGADVLKVPFMTDINSRVEVSFMNRIKTFCNHIFEKI